jgi:hypothetical protein
MVLSGENPTEPLPDANRGDDGGFRRWLAAAGREGVMDRKWFWGLGVCGLVLRRFAISGNVARYFNLAAVSWCSGGPGGVASQLPHAGLQYVFRVLPTPVGARMKSRRRSSCLWWTCL